MSVTLRSYEKEATDKTRDSWFLAFIMDTNEEQRAKGKTVEASSLEMRLEMSSHEIR